MKWLKDFGLPLALTLSTVVITFLFYVVTEVNSVNNRMDLISIRMDSISARLDFAHKSYTEISHGLIRLERSLVDTRCKDVPEPIKEP